MKRDFTDGELKAQILWSLYQHGKWSEIYTNYDTFKKRLSVMVKNNGKNTERQVKALVKMRMVLPRKNWDTISLNPYYKNTIKQMIKDSLGFEP
jgi:hypothetical protein